MMNNRFLRNVSANTFQTVINQVFGLAIFYALSKGIDKNLFGQINWALAVLLTSFGILTFGIDQVMVKKIAAGYNRYSIFSAYSYHVFISGFIFYGLLLIFYRLFPAHLSQKSLLLFIGVGKLAIYFSTPFKQLSAALEKFRELCRMSVVSNIFRGTVLLLLLFLHEMSIRNILICFIAGDLLELAFSYFITRPILKSPVPQKWSRRRQILLMRESLPQTGVVFFTAIMSRFDWIMVGLLISSTRLAEYSFAYKIFEVSTLPLLIVAPIMIPLFTRLQKRPEDMTSLSFFLEWQIILASGIALMLNTCWIPVIDFISDGKYGEVNSTTIFLLSLSMPLLYFSNYVWTIQFSRGNMRHIFGVMAVSLAVNIVGCSILIPLYKNEGAALAYFITALVQLTLYLSKKPYVIQKLRWRLALWPLTALASGILSYRFIPGPGNRVAVTIALFLTVLFLSGTIRIKDWRILQSLYK